MSVGIIQIPQQYDAAFNPNWYVVSGSQGVSGNYKLIARIQSPSGTIIAKLKKPTDPINTKTAVFDIHRVIENYVSYTIDPDIDRVTQATNNILSYLIEFGEEYGTPTPTEYYYSTYVYPQYALNIALSPKEFNAYDSGDYLIHTTGVKFLNKFKGNRKVFSTTRAFLYFLQDSSHRINGINVFAYDSGGNLIASSAIDQPFTGVASDEKLLYFPSGPQNLNLIPQAQLQTGTAGQIIPANTAYYEIQSFKTIGNYVSELLTYEIVENCSKYDNYPIYFLGQYGNVEVWNFNRRSDKKSTIERKMYSAPLGKFLNAQQEYGYDNSDREQTQYATEGTESVTLNTDLLSQEEYLFLKELIISPQVWSYEGGDLIPVVLTDSDYNEKKKVNDKVFNLTINIAYASVLEPQRF